ncbi:Dihydroneopterin aldolase [Chlamydiales bacterium SCGC AB-751-O23]|jgi:7,8-dihydroneopterin aldolase/epimerase/oxygenase|nr:Dihydroneopterin aldolase [Chlamydiales bacterium SCGC AB-751-O23]
MQACLGLNSMSLFVFLGVYDEEQRAPQEVKVDVELWVDIADCIKNDDVSKAVDYQEVVSLFQETVKDKSYNLIETLCAELAQLIINQFQKVQRVGLKLYKDRPLDVLASSSCELHLQREDEKGFNNRGS